MAENPHPSPLFSPTDLSYFKHRHHQKSSIISIHQISQISSPTISSPRWTMDIEAIRAKVADHGAYLPEATFAPPKRMRRGGGEGGGGRGAEVEVLKTHVLGEKAALRLRKRKYASSDHWWMPYAALLCGFLEMANCWGLIMSFGAFKYHTLPSLASRTDTEIGLIAGVQAVMVLGPTFIIGRLLDARFHRVVVVVGICFLTAGFLVASCAEAVGMGRSYGVVVGGQSVMAGLGMSCLFIHSSTNATQWWPDHKFIAIGVTTSGAAFGGLAYPPIIESLLSQYSFAAGMRYLAAVIGSTSLLILLCSSIAPAIQERPLEHLLSLSTWIDTKAFRNRVFVLYTLGVGFMFFGFYPLLFHLTDWAGQERFRGLAVVWYLTLTNGCSLIGRVGSGYLASRQWTNPLYIHASAALLPVWLVIPFWLYASTATHALIFCTLFGTTGGALFALPAAGVAYILPKESKDAYGAWTGMMWAASAGFAVTGPVFVGVLVRAYGVWVVGWWTGINLGVAFLGVAGAGVVGWREGRRGAGGKM